MILGISFKTFFFLFGTASSQAIESRFGISVKNWPRNLFLAQKKNRVFLGLACKNGAGQELSRVKLRAFLAGKNGAGQELSCKNGAGQNKNKKQKKSAGENGAGQELSRIKLRAFLAGKNGAW